MSGLRVETTWRTVPCQPSQVSTTSNVLSNTLVVILTHLGIGPLQWINHCYVQGCVKVHVAEILLLLDEGGPCSHALLWHRRRRLESTFPAGQPNALKEHSQGVVQPKTFPVHYYEEEGCVFALWPVKQVAIIRFRHKCPGCSCSRSLCKTSATGAESRQWTGWEEGSRCWVFLIVGWRETLKSCSALTPKKKIGVNISSR